jgi:hypothetical protein
VAAATHLPSPTDPMDKTKTISQYCPDKQQLSCEAVVTKVGKHHLSAFDPRTLDFLNQVSLSLLADKIYNRHPEIVSLAFWLRRTNLLQFRKENANWMDAQGYQILPMGMIFHIAPSNVDTIFLYSSCISLLMGNRNIVRLSSDIPDTVMFIIKCLNEVISRKENQLFGDYIRLVSYGHDDEINSYFSYKADGRVIWGGDSTILHFKTLKTAAGLHDFAFPNRVSHSLIHAGSFLASTEANKEELAKNFFNDAYVFDQLGCSSPRVIYVLGSNSEKAEFTKSFYTHLSAVTAKKYASQAGTLSSVKFNHLVSDVLDHPVSKVDKENNAIYFLEVSTPPVSVENCIGGYFYLQGVKDFLDLDEALPPSTQTLSYYGLQKTDLMEMNQLITGKRIDRIVPIGQALAFHYIWDGMNLFEQFSRKRFIDAPSKTNQERS